MRLTDHVRFGPFKTPYHRDLVDADFVHTFEQFLFANLMPQFDSPLRELDGSLTAAFDNEKNCGPNSLVRDIFSFECIAICDDGKSELKSDVVFDATGRTFTPRHGFDRYFYVWTPNRKRQRELELLQIQSVVDDIMRGNLTGLACPICRGNISAVNNTDIFDARCLRHRCFVYNYHKDERGRLAHGHFFTTHPMKRAEPVGL